jgi:hypothetical protein
LLAHIGAIIRLGKPAGAPAIVGDDAADNEGYIVVDCVAVIKRRELNERIVVRVVGMAHGERWNAPSVAKRRCRARFDGEHKRGREYFEAHLMTIGCS